LPLEAQTALLRELQADEVSPIGCTQPVKVNVRVVAATHQPLQQLIEEKRFRADLFARLAGYVHELWSLEARLEDFGVLECPRVGAIDFKGHRARQGRRPER